MKPPSSYKIASRARSFQAAFDPLDPLDRIERRTQRVVDSLRSEIIEAGAGQRLSIRQVFANPREIFRLELELPELSYQRVTLLDRDALEELLETDEVRAVLTQRLNQLRGSEFTPAVPGAGFEPARPAARRF